MINVKVAGTKTSNARATPGGTCSGILIFNASCFSKNKKRKSKRASLTFPTSFSEYSCQKNI